MNKSARKWALGAARAAVAGYVGGILTAPQSGKETRADIKKAANRSVAEAEKQLKKLHTQMAETIAQAKDKTNEYSGIARKDLQAAIEKATKAKEKARELLSALHEGTADDKDLDKAIGDANNAIAHLKDYLKKS